MRIMILGDAQSPHTIKWANALANSGIEICILSFRKAEKSLYNTNIRLISLDNIRAKTFYIKLLPIVKDEIKIFKPHILHAFYATSYGFIGALTRFSPFVISIWGSDIFEFPRKSILHKTLVKYNLRKATFLQSTSHAMAKEALKYTQKPFSIIPFGIDIKQFSPEENISKAFVIGTVKWLENIYGINYLIETFKILIEKHPNRNLKLLIVGKGSRESEYRKMVDDFGITDKVEFVGAVANTKTVKYYRQMSVFVALSLQESFGVAILEAEACGIPAVVTDVGGLPEVVINNKTGYIVESKNPQQAAEAISKLILDNDLHSRFCNNAREFVVENYNWEENIIQQIELYKSYI